MKNLGVIFLTMILSQFSLAVEPKGGLTQKLNEQEVQEIHDIQARIQGKTPLQPLDITQAPVGKAGLEKAKIDPKTLLIPEDVPEHLRYQSNDWAQKLKDYRKIGSKEWTCAMTKMTCFELATVAPLKPYGQHLSLTPPEEESTGGTTSSPEPGDPSEKKPGVR